MVKQYTRVGKIKKEPIASDIITYVLFPERPSSKQNYVKVYFPTKGELYFKFCNVYCTIRSLFADDFGNVYLTITSYPAEETVRNEEYFINNMTHELKTPVSTISTCGTDVERFGFTKSPDVFKHISGVYQ